MNGEKKAFIMILLVYLCIICLFLYVNVKDFVKYKMHSEEYQVLKVKIIDTNIRSRRFITTATATFNYYVNGEKRTGQTGLNYNEKQGDYIDIAFDGNMDYVRTQIIVSSIWDCVEIIFYGIVILYAGYKVFKKE